MMEMIFSIKDSNNLYSIASSSVNDDIGGHRYLEFRESDMSNPKFMVGIKFSNTDQIKIAFNVYALKKMYNIRFIKNDRRRVYAKCRGCKGQFL